MFMATNISKLSPPKCQHQHHCSWKLNKTWSHHLIREYLVGISNWSSLCHWFSWTLFQLARITINHYFESFPNVIINKLIQCITFGFRAGLSINRFIHGYHTLTEIFEFVIFLFANLNFVLSRGSQGPKNRSHLYKCTTLYSIDYTACSMIKMVYSILSINWLNFIGSWIPE